MSALGCRNLSASGWYQPVNRYLHDLLVRGGYDVCPGPNFRGNPKGHSSRLAATYELPGCRISAAIFVCGFTEVDLKTIRLNTEQRRWMLGYLHTSQDYDRTDPVIIQLRALLERPEVTDINVREDQAIVQVMIKEMGG